MTSKKIILGRLVLMLLPLAAAALLLYLVGGRRRTPLDYIRHPMEGHPLQAQYEADRARFPIRLAYYDYWLYAFQPYTSATINISGFYSARLAPASAPAEAAALRVWMFGGSTLADMETADELTIANQAAVELARQGFPAEVLNFGMPGFASSLELLKFQDILRRTPENRRPQVVVFYDGYNDPYLGWVGRAGGLQPDLSAKLEMVVTRQTLRYLLHRLSDALGERWPLWHRTVGHRLAARAIRQDRNLDEVVQIYLDNVRMARAIAREFRIRPLFVLQPLLMTKQPRTEEEEKIFAAGGQALKSFVLEFYRQVRTALGPEADFLDLSGVLDGRDQTDFYDECHVRCGTGSVIGAAIGRHLAENLRDPGGLDRPLAEPRAEDNPTPAAH